MIVGLGIDVCEIARLRRALAGASGARLRERVFTAAEIAECESRGRGRMASYAARFAAKEAVAKALGVGIGARAGWRDVAVVAGPNGDPGVCVTGTARRTAETRGVVRWHLALTHAAGVAIAVVVAEGRVTRGARGRAGRSGSPPPTGRR